MATEPYRVKVSWLAEVMERAMAKKPLPPGTPAPHSGQYKVPGSKTEVTAIEGKPLPPTPKKGQGYVSVDPTKHKK